MAEKTVQIHLPDGESRGIRIATITPRIVEALVFPRKCQKTALKREEAKRRAAFYFLFEQNDQSAKSMMVYVGETTNVPHRFGEHNRKKDFWQTAFIFTSKSDAFTSNDVEYLQWLSITTAKDVNRYQLSQKDHKKPYVDPSMEHELRQVFENAALLLGTLGFPVFEPLVKDTERKDTDVFHCQGRDATATGQLVEDGFVVFKDSKGRKNAVRTAHPWIDTLRPPLIKQGILKAEGKHYIFTEDVLFKSPSAAGVVVLARNSDGWRDWKTHDRKTLHEVKRAGLAQSKGTAT